MSTCAGMRSYSIAVNGDLRIHAQSAKDYNFLTQHEKLSQKMYFDTIPKLVKTRLASLVKNCLPF